MILFTWQPVTEQLYDHYLNVLPPAWDTYCGFLMGEAIRDRICTVSGPNPVERAVYYALRCSRPDAFEQKLYGRRPGWWMASEPLTIPEFIKALRETRPQEIAA